MLGLIDVPYKGLEQNSLEHRVNVVQILKTIVAEDFPIYLKYEER